MMERSRFDLGGLSTALAQSSPEPTVEEILHALEVGPQAVLRMGPSHIRPLLKYILEQDYAGENTFMLRYWTSVLDCVKEWFHRRDGECTKGMQDSVREIELQDPEKHAEVIEWWRNVDREELRFDINDVGKEDEEIVCLVFDMYEESRYCGVLDKVLEVDGRKVYEEDEERKALIEYLRHVGRQLYMRFVKDPVSDRDGEGVEE